MDLQKFNTEKFSAFYEKTKFELSQIESEFLQLEKEYFNLTPLYDKIFDRLQKLANDANQNEATLLKYRITSLYRDLMKFHHTSGYNSDAFHLFFNNLRNINEKLANEVFSESAVQLIKEKIKNEAKKWIPDGLPAGSPMRKFLALKNDDTCYLIPFRKKIWEKRVENRKKIKIQIKSIPGNNIFSFHSLPSLPKNSGKKEKLALLLELENGNKYGILADQIEGIMIFSEKFIKKHTDFFPAGEGKYQPYLQLKGQRYFLRHPEQTN